MFLLYLFGVWTHLVGMVFMWEADCRSLLAVLLLEGWATQRTGTRGYGAFVGAERESGRIRSEGISSSTSAGCYFQRRHCTDRTSDRAL